MKHPYALTSRKSLKTISIVLGSMTVAFLLGIETASDVQPLVGQTQAGADVIQGDMNGNGILDLGDVEITLELAQGYRTPTPSELGADPNQDFQITVDDAIAIVKTLARQPTNPAIEP